VKNYNDVRALRGVSFEVAEGEVFGLLGPNGAGKTTTVEILEGLRSPDSGFARVAGLDPEEAGMAFKEKIGAVLQSTALPEKLKVIEALELFSGFYGRRTDPEVLLKRFQLDEKRNAFYGTLSGGQKQRLALALALVNDPALLFLDEPTTGLDPQVRAEIHGLLEQSRDEKRTILLTTHYIEEAERLCDRVAIVDQGRIIAMDTPRKLQQQSRAASTIVVTCDKAIPAQRPVWAEAVESIVDSTGHTLTVISRRPAATLVDLIKWIDQSGLELVDVHLKKPTLEDVFIELTGKRLRE